MAGMAVMVGRRERWVEVHAVIWIGFLPSKQTSWACMHAHDQQTDTTNSWRAGDSKQRQQIAGAPEIASASCPPARKRSKEAEAAEHQLLDQHAILQRLVSICLCPPSTASSQQPAAHSQPSTASSHSPRPGRATRTIHSHQPAPAIHSPQPAAHSQPAASHPQPASSPQPAAHSQPSTASSQQLNHSQPAAHSQPPTASSHSLRPGRATRTIHGHQPAAHSQPSKPAASIPQPASSTQPATHSQQPASHSQSAAHSQPPTSGHSLRPGRATRTIYKKAEPSPRK